MYTAEGPATAERARGASMLRLLETVGGVADVAGLDWAELELQKYITIANQALRQEQLLGGAQSVDGEVLKHQALRVAHTMFEHHYGYRTKPEDEGMMLGCLQLAEPNPELYMRFLDSYAKCLHTIDGQPFYDARDALYEMIDSSGRQ